MKRTPPKPQFPLTVALRDYPGITAKIYRSSQKKNGQDYQFFSVAYSLLGRRRQETRATFEDAKTVAEDAIRKIGDGQQEGLTLTQTDRHTYQRAVEALATTGRPLDVAAREYADALTIMAGRGGLVEAARFWAKHHSVALPRITVADAVVRMLDQERRDGKSEIRLHHLGVILHRFARSFNCQVHELTPALISEYLAALPLAPRSKRNHRDTVGYFSRWLILNGFLPKGTDLLDGVRNYTARKIGEISTYTAEEMTRLIAAADAEILPFIVIAGFAGLRHAEIVWLDWSDVDLDERFVEVKAAKSKTDTRRIVPITDNLAAWLQPIAQKEGPVVAVGNTTKELLKTASAAGIGWKHNALRHTYISARVAESGDVPRVADEAGNSVQIIRTNYLKRMRPTLAAEWFGIVPSHAKNIVSLTAAA
jgi:integrase